jgi:hypothetical protein
MERDGGFGDERAGPGFHRGAGGRVDDHGGAIDGDADMDGDEYADPDGERYADADLHGDPDALGGEHGGGVSESGERRAGERDAAGLQRGGGRGGADLHDGVQEGAGQDLRERAVGDGGGAGADRHLGDAPGGRVVLRGGEGGGPALGRQTARPAVMLRNFSAPAKNLFI